MNLIKRSLELDFYFLKIDIPLGIKLDFIYRKYFLLLKHILKRVSIGDDYINIFSYRYYYDDKFGISFLQSVYVDNIFLKKYIKPNSVIVDVGANIGQFNVFCKNYLKAKRIYSFEPIKESFSLLKKNVVDKKYIYDYAVGEKSKNMTFYIPDTSLMASSVQPKKYKSTEVVKVRNINKDVKDNTIDLLKIDTEGSELEVINASKNILKKSNYILIELSLNRESKGNLVELINLLSSILPNINVVEIGRVFVIEGVQNSVDILFKNEKN